MKFLLIVAAVVAVAHAKINLYVDDKLIENEKLASMQFKHERLVSAGDEVEGLPKNVVDDLIIRYLEKLRENFETGWPELGIPPVDPFQLEQTNFTLNQPLVFKANVKFTDILMTGLKDFIIQKINFNLVRLTFDFEIIAPDTVFQSAFDVNGRIAVVQKFQFDGHMRARMQGFYFGGSMSMGTTPDGYLTLKTFKLLMDVDDVSLYVSGVGGDGPLEDIFNYIMSKLTGDFISDALASMSEQLSVALFDSVNEVLNKIKLSDLIG